MHRLKAAARTVSGEFGCLLGTSHGARTSSQLRSMLQSVAVAYAILIMSFRDDYN